MILNPDTENKKGIYNCFDFKIKKRHFLYVQAILGDPAVNLLRKLKNFFLFFVAKWWHNTCARNSSSLHMKKDRLKE